MCVADERQLRILNKVAPSLPELREKLRTRELWNNQKRLKLSINFKFRIYQEPENFPPPFLTIFLNQRIKYTIFNRTVIETLKRKGTSHLKSDSTLKTSFIFTIFLFHPCSTKRQLLHVSHSASSSTKGIEREKKKKT